MVMLAADVLLKRLPTHLAQDTVCTTDFPTGFGTSILANFVPSRDADLVGRLRACSAIIFGKVSSECGSVGGDS